MHFFDRLAARIDAVDSVVSVGLDPDPDRIPDHLADADLPRWAFNRRIIDATHEHAAAYKPNAAFYEDSDGWRALRETVAYAHGKDVPVLLDAKRADIGNTARQYASLLDETGADAVTVNPYMGRDSLEPFLSRTEFGVFVLCRTSNAGGSDIQDLELASGDPVYERVAELASEWNDNRNVGLVVGATAPEAFDDAGRALIDALFETVIEVPDHEARHQFACNAHCPDGAHVLIQEGCEGTNAQLRNHDFVPVELDTSEFMKSGGSVFCMKQMIW